MEKKVGVNQSANDYMQNATNLDKAMTAPPTPKVPVNPGNNGGPLADGPAERGHMNDVGDGSYAAGMEHTKSLE